jgi:hypothetical protein
MAACFALCTMCTFEAIGFLIDRRAKLQIICFICCICGAINSGLILFLTIFPPGFCWWLPMGSVFYEASLISTTFIMVIRARAVIPTVSLLFRQLFWMFSTLMIATQFSIGVAIATTTKFTSFENNACSSLLSANLMTAWYGSIILTAIVLTSIFSYSLMKTHQHGKESFFRTVLISSGASAVISGVSQVTFTILLALDILPPQYELILVKSDMTINILITVTFVRRLMKESALYGSTSSICRTYPAQEDPEIQLHSVRFETVRPTSEVPKPPWIITRY